MWTEPPYPATGTIYDPLLDVDFTHQIYAVAAKEKWPLYEPSIFFIFIGAGVRECGTAPCKYSPDSCAMHWGLEYGVTWAAVNDPGLPDCAPVRRRTPNNDALADMAINFASHELFEAVTDPVPCEGWVRKCGEDVLPREIGDLCVHDFARLNRDGSDVVLHDHTYLLQEEWSNRAGRCVLPSSAYPPPRPASPITWGGIPPGIVLGTVLALLLTALAAFLVRSMQRRPGSESTLSQPDSS